MTALGLIRHYVARSSKADALPGSPICCSCRAMENLVQYEAFSVEVQARNRGATSSHESSPLRKSWDETSQPQRRPASFVP